MKEKNTFANKLGSIIANILITCFFGCVTICLVAIMVSLTFGLINFMF